MSANGSDEVVSLIYEAKNLSSEELYKLADDLESLALAAKRAEKDLDNLKVDQANLSSFEEMGAEMSVLESKLIDARVEYKKLNEALKKNKNASDDERKRVEKAALAVDKHRRALNSQGAAYRKLKKALSPLGVTTKNVTDIQERLTSEISKSERTIEGMSRAYEKQVTTLKEKTSAEKESIESTKRQLEAEQALAKVYRDAANDRLKTLNKQIADARRLAEEKEQSSIKAKEAAEREKEAFRELKQSLGEYESKLQLLNEEKRKGVLSTGDYIRAEEALRKELKLSESQSRTSKRAIEAESRAVESQIKIANDAAEAKKRQAAIEEKAAIAKLKAASEQKRVTAALKDYEKQLVSLYEKLERGDISKAEFIRKEALLRKELKLTEKQVKTSAAAIKAHAATLKKSSSGTDLLTSATRRLAQAYTVLLAAQKATEGVMSSVRGYGELEAAVTKVEKTTGMAREQVIAIQDELTRMATEVTPTATNELLRYGEVAGQLGANSSEDILMLVSAADALNVSTDLAGDTAITLLSRILKMTDEGAPAIGGLASSVVALGNNLAASESEIVEMTKEIVTGTTAINLGSSAAAAFGGVLREMGETGERSRTAFLRLSQVIERAALEGGEQMERLGNITSMTGDEIRDSLANGETEKVLMAFLEGLSGVTEEGGNAGDALRAMGITANESIGVLRKLAGRTVYLGEVLDMSNAARETEMEHIKEAAKAYADQESAMGKLINKFTSLQASVGEAYADETFKSIEFASKLIDDNAESVVQLMENMAELGEGIMENVSHVGLMVDAFLEWAGVGDITLNVFDRLKVAMNGWTVAGKYLTKSFIESRISVLELRDSFSLLDEAGQKNLNGLKASANDLKMGILTDLNDIQRANARIAGESSNAYEGLIDAARDYSEGLDGLSESQKAQIEVMLEAGGYREEDNDTYRRLTALIMRNVRVVEAEVGMLERKKKADDDARNAAAARAEVESAAHMEALRLLDEVGDSTDALVEKAKKLREERDAGNISLDVYTEKTDTLKLAQSLLTKSTEEAKDASDLLFAGYSTASDEVFNLEVEIRKQERAVEDLKNQMLEAGKSTQQLIYIKIKLRDLDKEITANKERLAYIREVEKMTIDEVVKSQKINLEQMEELEGKYRSGKLNSKEYADAKAEIKEKIDILNEALGDNKDLLEEDGKKTGEVTETKKKMADEIERVTDLLKGESDALRENTEELDKNNWSAERRNNLAEMRSDESAGTPEAKALIEKIGLDEYNKKLNALIADSIGINGINSAKYKQLSDAFEREKAQAYKEAQRAEKYGDDNRPGVGSGQPVRTTSEKIYTVQIKTPSGSTPIRVSSERDAESLLGALGQLGEINIDGVS